MAIDLEGWERWRATGNSPDDSRSPGPAASTTDFVHVDRTHTPLNKFVPGAPLVRRILPVGPVSWVGRHPLSPHQHAPRGNAAGGRVGLADGDQRAVRSQ